MAVGVRQNSFLAQPPPSPEACPVESSGKRLIVSEIGSFIGVIKLQVGMITTRTLVPILVSAPEETQPAPRKEDKGQKGRPTATETQQRTQISCAHLVLLRTSCTKAAGVEQRAGGLTADGSRAHAAICTYEKRSSPIREWVWPKVTILQKTVGEEERWK